MMNKNGFAVSIILYSIVFMIVMILYILLGIVKTRYTVSDRLRQNIISDLNENMASTSFVSLGNCIIEASNDDYDNDLVLTIDTPSGVLYSWDNENWSSENSINVDRNGIYMGYFQDSVGGVGSCSVEIISKTRYQSRDCAIDDLNYSEWYIAHHNTCSDGVVLKSGGESVNLNYAENHYLTYYYTDCGTIDSNTCCKEYNRNITSCKWSKGETWNEWQDFRPNGTSSNQIRSATFYKIKN